MKRFSFFITGLCLLVLYAKVDAGTLPTGSCPTEIVRSSCSECPASIDNVPVNCTSLPSGEFCCDISGIATGGVSDEEELKICSNVSALLTEIIGGRAVRCVEVFTAILVTPESQFCQALWSGLYCTAGYVVSAINFPNCLVEMEREIQKDPEAIFEFMKDSIGEANVPGHVINAGSCDLATYLNSLVTTTTVEPDSTVKPDVDDYMHKCKGGHSPMPDVDCLSRVCPGNYTCELKKFCCPTQREGMCPMTRQNALCVERLRCNTDMDCADKMKCCDQGCLFKTCAMIETREKSMCELTLDRARERLYSHGACGDGTGIIEVPHCQNTKFAPIQGDIASGSLYCVTEDGMKIPGSEFRGNIDCPRTHPGKCPEIPTVCQTAMENDNDTAITNLCMSDDKCSRGQKCCYSNEGGFCVRRCVTAMSSTEPIEVCPNGVERKCCAVNLCQGKICAAHPAAVCRINPCGECHVEFFDADNNKVNCTEGLSMCLMKKLEARMKNQELSKNHVGRLNDFIKSFELYPDDMMSSMDMDKDMDLEDLRLNLGMDMMSMDYMSEDKENVTNEYGEMAMKDTEMPTDERIEEIFVAYLRTYTSYMQDNANTMCGYINSYGICQNGGTCIIGSENVDGYLQLCSCQPGFYGLFCEIPGTLNPDTSCTRYKVVTEHIWRLAMQHNALGELVHRLITIFRLNFDIMPRVTCDANGLFTEVQHGVILPYIMYSPEMQFCVDVETGIRRDYTLIAPDGDSLNCSILVAPDVLTLPKKCRLQPGAPCPANEPCQYYFNSVTKTCERSYQVGVGYDDVTQCYMECGLQLVSECPPWENPDGCPRLDAPVPCRNAFCNYLTDFCMVEETASGQTGQCMAMKPYCMQTVDPGTGDKVIGAYFFDMSIRRCSKFNYHGEGGNTNRFYSLHQCQTECGLYGRYKNPEPVCPIPRAVTPPGSDPATMDMCVDDYNCMDNQVCCSNGRVRVCADPVTVCGSQRCSPEAACVRDTCLCPSCEDEASNPVCASNGHSFENLCMLKKYACETMMNITAVPCESTSTTVMPPSCPMACTEEYNPVCAYDTTNSPASPVTYPNFCHMTRSLQCEMKHLQLLYFGECESGECEGSDRPCEPYKACVDGACRCPVCDETPDTVCAHPEGNPGSLMNFTSICAMRQYACERQEVIVLRSQGPCPEQAPVMPSGSCPMICTADYTPVCAYDTTNSPASLVTYSNLCQMRGSIMCEKKQLKLLYNGECMSRECEGSDSPCTLYETCVDGECKCPECDVNPDPVCAHPEGLEGSTMTFSSICAMRRYACEQQALYVIRSHGPCTEPVEEYECPATESDIVYSAVRLCHPDTNAYCGEKSKCCLYGTGYRCIPMRYLKRKVITRPGFCPIVSYFNFNRNNCWNKALMCRDDSDAPVNSKCCNNFVCGHNTITVPLALESDGVCGNNMMAVPEVTCNPDGADTCPEGSTCTSVETQGWTMGLCCKDSSNSGDLIIDDMTVNGNMLCNILDRLGMSPICQNGGQCIGNVRMAQICDCPAGFYGAFCEVPGSNPTHCQRFSSIMTAVFSLFPEDRRRKRGVPVTSEDSSSGEEENQEEMPDMNVALLFGDPNLVRLGVVMVKMGFPYVPYNGMVNCENDGSYSKAQCYDSVQGEHEVCACVDVTTGMMIRDGPMADTLEELDCNFLAPEFPRFCLTPPSNQSCGQSEVERYYFCKEAGECMPYMDRGCNDIKFGNSFESLDKCRSVCSAKSVTPVGCETVRCAAGTECKKRNGTVECVDVTRVLPTMRYLEPQCDENGDFSPRQCHGNVCMCVEKDGTLVEGSVGDGQNLKCTRDESGMTVGEVPQPTQEKKCSDGSSPQYCDQPGDPCNNCEMPDGVLNNMQNPSIDNDGACKNCQICPSGQGREVCETNCDTQPECAKFPQAQCRVDRCTCTAKFYKYGNEEVNCNAFQSKCEKEKALLERQKDQESFQQSLDGSFIGQALAMVMKCSADGTYFAQCDTTGCYCLNATSGSTIGQGQMGVTVDNINCAEVKRVTLAKIVRGRMKISDGNLADLPAAVQTKISQRFITEFLAYGIKIIKGELGQGSVIYIYEGEVDVTSAAVAETGDLSSLVDIAHSELNGKAIVIDGYEFVVSEPTIQEFLTEEDVPTTAKPDDDDDNDNTPLIIGVVVGGVALLLIIVAVCVVVNRSRHSKGSSMQFSDLQGKDNPMYNKP